jgi:hypothetical protein
MLYQCPCLSDYAVFLSLNQNCQVARKKTKRNNSISDPPYPPLRMGESDADVAEGSIFKVQLKGWQRINQAGGDPPDSNWGLTSRRACLIWRISSSHAYGHFDCRERRHDYVSKRRRTYYHYSFGNFLIKRFREVNPKNSTFYVILFTDSSI